MLECSCIGYWMSNLFEKLVKYEVKIWMHKSLCFYPWSDCFAVKVLEWNSE